MFRKKYNTFGISYIKASPSLKTQRILNVNNKILNSSKLKVNNNDLSDEQGLKRAYQQPNKIYVDGNKMYIAGTSSLGDWYDDFTKIPIWGDLKNSQRYIDAEKVLKDNPQVDSLVSHSLGGAVALELDKDRNNKFKNVTTYGAPVLETPAQTLFNKLSSIVSHNNNEDKNVRYRHPFDPVSFFDSGAKTVFNPTTINPHSYTGYKEQGKDSSKVI